MLKTLCSDIELFAAMLSQAHVNVWHRTVVDFPCLIEYGGIIEQYTPTSVKIAGVYYSREDYEFRVKMITENG